MRTHLPDNKKPDLAGIRKITGEALPSPVVASIYDGAQKISGQPQGTHEEVDPIDATIAVTSDYGLTAWECIDDPQRDTAPKELESFTGSDYWSTSQLLSSPHSATYQGWVWPAHQRKKIAQELLNQGKDAKFHTQVLAVYFCLRSQTNRRPTGKLLVKHLQSPDAARLRWQNALSPRSFHSAIFGSRANHANVTAYDVAIGSGKASTDPNFYAYLCAVADWRLKKNTTKNAAPRKTILSWEKFEATFASYWQREPEWRKQLIEGNADYYSTGKLPILLPALPDGLPPTIVCETVGIQADWPKKEKTT